MKESKFIEQNKKNWQEYEKDLRYSKNKAIRLSNLFVQITDDLSFANTYYKFRSVKVYLNGIAQSLYNDLYRNTAGSWKAFAKYWKTDLPLYIHQARIEFRVSFLIFIISAGIGILSSIYDKNFASFILGDSYINMTLENIKNNDPMAVYKDSPAAEMFLQITLNNLYVALLTYVLGLFFSIGTILFLIYNGIMVGTFQYFFIEKGLFTQSFLTIWQHGTLEISSIIIAGAAGILMGKGLVFPGTYKRTDSFKLTATRGLKIFTGITPIFLIAAFIEGFLTRHTSINNYARLAVILLSLFFILFYFVWYPWYLSKRKKIELEIKPEEVKFIKPAQFDFSKILTAQEIFGYTLRAIFQNKLFIFKWVLGLAFIATVLVLFNEYSINPDFYKKYFPDFGILFYLNNKMLLFLISTVILTVLKIALFKRIHPLIASQEKQKMTFPNYLNLLFSFWFTSAALIAPFFGGIFWSILTIILLSPIILFACYIAFLKRIFIFFTFGHVFRLISQNWGKFYWNSIKIFGLFIAFIYFFQSTIVNFYIKSVTGTFINSGSSNYLIEIFVFVFITFFIFSILFLLHAINSIINYYAFNETVNAESLKERIEKFGERNIMFGFEKEHQKP